MSIDIRISQEMALAIKRKERKDKDVLQLLKETGVECDLRTRTQNWKKEDSQKEGGAVWRYVTLKRGISM